MPVRFQIAGDAEEHEGETFGFSPEQLFMSTLHEVPVGTELAITIRVPVELSGSSFNEVAFSGKVLSVSKLARNTFGCQVAIEQRDSTSPKNKPEK